MLSEEQKYFTNFSSSRALVTIGQGQLHFIAENYLQFANILLEYYTRIGRKQSHGAIREEEIKKMNSLLRPHKITHTHTHTRGYEHEHLKFIICIVKFLMFSK